jgi:hypothetical protein
MRVKNSIIIFCEIKILSVHPLRKQTESYAINNIPLELLDIASAVMF